MKGKNFDEVSRKYPKFVSYPKIPYLEEKREIQSKEGYFFEKIDGSASNPGGSDFQLYTRRFRKSDASLCERCCRGDW